MALRGDRLRAASTLVAAPDAAPRLDLRSRTQQRSTLLAAAAAVLVILAFGAGLYLVFAQAVARPQAAAPVTTGTASTGAGTVVDSASSTSADPASALEAQRRSDLAALSDAEDLWFPQLSSKKVGTRADGRVYDAAAIWTQFEGLKARYPQARLVRSDDWGSFRQGGYWVVLVDSRSAIGSAANQWCDAEGFPADDCYAKRLSHSGGYAGNTISRN